MAANRVLVAVVMLGVIVGGIATAAPEEQIQINVAQAPLDQVLRMIGEAGHVDIVIPPELAGKTVKGLQLQGAPVSDVLASVLMPYGYDAVMEGNTYTIRMRQDGAQPLLHIGARLIRLLSVDFDRLTAHIPPEQQTILPGGISVVRGRLFPTFVPLLSSNTAQIIVEPHCSAPSGKRVSVPINQSRKRDLAAEIASDQLLFGVSEAYITPEIRADDIAVSLSLQTSWTRLESFGHPTQLAVEIPKLPLKWGDELWVRGWQRLVDPPAAPAGSEIVLVLSVAKQPLEE